MAVGSRHNAIPGARVAGEIAAKPYHGLVGMGHQITFFAKALGAIPLTLKNYRAEVFRLLADISWGSGAVIVGGGTVGVMALLAVFTGASVGIEGYNALDILGMAPLTGFVSAYGNTREIAPLIAAVAFAVQAGCRYTAQLGSMRISEEIDALESMSIRPLPYLVTTRLIAGFIAIIPLYMVGLAGNYLSTQLILSKFYGQSSGTYQHYFQAFLVPSDVLLSVVKAVTFVVIATLIHCYYGFYATGGPQGVGLASGRAIRASIVAIVIVDMLMTLAFWGFDPGVRISG
ncbi:MAG: Phospholipid/cholesterol/gamma-HCH transport system permease protein [Amycolatopsis sp.]|uniref:MlaE family ABC transporter permease n=1 Tax=Amycolatopsis sp. TaxID=37632 RepID=UPI00262F788C|nr:ABC transporter permease [Amycolatopsis sp.]MCU1685369.1 Phospholipid/cholesterol/gamma-HCH transport system permease protein [Amycolatopsis sp.]